MAWDRDLGLRVARAITVTTPPGVGHRGTAHEPVGSELVLNPQTFIPLGHPFGPVEGSYLQLTAA